MTLVLEIEYLSDVVFAAIDPESEQPDWPPQPDRVFSALVATWAARGETQAERQALKWLEKLPVPRLAASSAEPRTGALVFVPPNDPRSDKGKHAEGVLPALRARQSRRFPATRPHDPVIRFFWPEAAPEPHTLASLQLLARDTAYVGHSASLTRCRFLLDQDAPGLDGARQPERGVYDGRLEELCGAYARFAKSASRKDRPQPGARVTPQPAAKRRRGNLFAGERWLILDHVAGRMPDIRACALVAKTIRDALLSGYRQIGLDAAIPETVSGHAPDGRPTRVPHLAILPLSFVGFPHADGHVMGFALVPPDASGILGDKPFLQALRTVAPLDEDRGRRILCVKAKAGTAAESAFHIDLSPAFEPPAERQSLAPALYLGPAPETVVADKHSAIEGAASAYPSGKSPVWTGWRLPPSLAGRQLTHAVIRFAEPVDGPVVLGAGRFLGLGLCRPLDKTAS